MLAPWRDDVDDALEDYAHCFRAQDGVCGEGAQAEAMRSAAKELLTTVHGGANQRGAVWCWRIQGNYAAQGPWRLTRVEPEKDGAEVVRALATADGREPIGKLAQQVLLRLTKATPREDKKKVHDANREHMHQTKQRMLSQAAEEHACPIVVGLEIHRARMLLETCASTPELHDLR